MTRPDSSNVMMPIVFVGLLLSLVTQTSGANSRPAGDAPPPTTTASQPSGLQPYWVMPADAPWWERDGLVIARVDDVPADRAIRATAGRTRTPTYNELEDRKLERSDEMLKALRGIGVSLVIVPYGGFGPDVQEAEEREVARDTIARAQKLGLRCGVWLPVNQVDPAAWESVKPDIASWLAVDSRGKPLAASFLGRKHLSLAVDEVRARMRRLAREAIVDARADAVFLPEWRISMGHEPAGLRRVREQLVKWYGETDPRCVEAIRQLEDPKATVQPDSALGRAWTAARVSLLREALDEIAAEAKKADRPVLVGIEPMTLARQIAWPSGSAIEPGSLLRGCDVVFEPRIPSVSRDESVVQQVVEMKLARAAGCAIATRQLFPLALAQQFAFGGDAAGVAVYFAEARLANNVQQTEPVAPLTISMVQSYRRRRALYAGMRPRPDVLMYLPPDARLFATGRHEILQIQTANALVTHRVPFDFWLESLPPASAVGRALVVAGVPVLTREQAGGLRRFLADGGGVLVIGETHVRDDLDASERGPTLDSYLGASRGPATTSGPAATSAPSSGGVSVGRVFAMDAPGVAHNFWITSARSRKAGFAPPLEDDELARTIRAMLGRPLSVEATLGRGIALELTEDAAGRRTVVHVVNFNRKAPDAVPSITVRVPAARQVRHVLHFRGEREEATSVPFKRDQGTLMFDAGLSNHYDAFLIESSATEDSPCPTH